MRRIILLLTLATLSLTGCDLVHQLPDPGDDDSDPITTPTPEKRPMILNLKGTAEGEPRMLMIDGEQTEANCFTVDLFDLSMNKKVGQATDCLTVEQDEQTSGLEVIGTTIFDFGEGNSFTSRGLTSVQPTTHGSPDFTHITGAIPPEGENSIIEAMGRFSGLEARVRLSGAVDMSRISSDNMVSFDCIFVVHPLPSHGDDD